MYHPLVDVQIVNYKTRAYLPSCINSVLEDADRSGIKTVVHIADNNSGDDLSFLSSDFPDAYLSVLDRNIGYGAANNYLANEGVCPFILVLNPDTVIEDPKTLERLLRWLRGGQYGVAGPHLHTSHGESQPWDHGDLGGGFAGEIVRNLGRSIYRKQSDPTQVAWVSGAYFLIARQVFEEIGGFDEKFFLYKEEEDLCLRLRQQGHRIMYDPAVSVLHHGSVVASKDEHMAGSEQYFIEKHCNKRWQRWARLALRWKP